MFHKVRRLVSGSGHVLLEVALIIFSILFAFWVDRQREAREAISKRDQYLAEIARDLDKELRVSKMNLRDCENDNNDLWWVITQIENRKTDSLEEVRNRFLRTFYKGVFREFGPNTLDGMQMNGDLELIQDPGLRKWLTAAFGFRTQVQRQFELYDQETEEAGGVLFEAMNPLADNHFKPDPQRLFQPTNRKALFQLVRRANYKGFILENYIADLDSARFYLNRFQKENNGN